MTSSNITPEDLLLGYANPAYDQHAKRLLAQRDVVARILKGVVPEFHHVDLATIASQCIEGEPEIGAIPVDMDKTNAARQMPKELRGDNTESVSPTEGWIRFDILFHAKVPRTGMRIALIVNIEAQKTQSRSRLGYALLRRAVYYACRLISSQKETEFSKSNYDDIKKVYSVWICMDAPNGKSAINVYDMQERHLLHHTKAEKRHYDLLSIIMIYLGADDSGNDLIRFLNLLFRDTARSAAEKKKILEAEFDLDISSDMEKEMNTMCNLSEGIFERGIEQGILQGREQGILQGREQGILQGREQGILQGREQGILQGREQGILQGESGMILSMLRKGYDLTNIADISQWPIKKIEQLAKSHHLL